MKMNSVAAHGSLVSCDHWPTLLVTMSVVLGAIIPWNASAEPEWKQLRDMPGARWEPGAVVIDEKLYVFGGEHRGFRTGGRVDIYDPKTNTWRQLADAPGPISHMNTVLDGRTVWYAGGQKNNEAVPIAEVWSYDVDKDTYTAGPDLPEPRSGGGLALVGRRLHYIGGGKAGRNEDGDNNWVLTLDDIASGWSNVAPMPAPRMHHATIVHQGKIYAIGGQFSHFGPRARGGQEVRVDIYDPEKDAWSRGPDLPKTHCQSEASTLISNGRIIVVGGQIRVGKMEFAGSDIWALESDEWKTVGQIPKPRIAAAAGIIAGKLYVAGGSFDGNQPLPEMWVCDAP